MGPIARAASPTPAVAAAGFPLTCPRSGGPRDHGQLGHAPSPVVRTAARLRKLPPLRPLPEPPRLQPGLGRTGGALRSWDRSGFLQLQVGPHPPGHVTGEGAAPAGGLELAFWGPSLLLVPPAWDLAPTLPSRGSRAGRKPVSLRLKNGKGPSLRATAHECEPYTCSLEHPAEKHVFLSQY